MTARKMARGSINDPKYLGTYLGGYSTEEEAFISDPYSVAPYGEEDGNDYVFPIPANELEGERMLDEILEGTPTPKAVRDTFRTQLWAGTLLKSTVMSWRQVNEAA